MASEVDSFLAEGYVDIDDPNYQWEADRDDHTDEQTDSEVANKRALELLIDPKDRQNLCQYINNPLTYI